MYQGRARQRRICIPVNLRDVPRAQNAGVEGHFVGFQADKESKVYSYESLLAMSFLCSMSASQNRAFLTSLSKKYASKCLP
jgi:hypothetical protein